MQGQQTPSMEDQRRVGCAHTILQQGSTTDDAHLETQHSMARHYTHC